MMMESLQVGVLGSACLAGRLYVVDFRQVFQDEQESTGSTTPVLRPEESPEGDTGLGVTLQTLCPVKEVAVEEGCVLAHLDMAASRWRRPCPP
jgi:hypothetical protein